MQVHDSHVQHGFVNGRKPDCPDKCTNSPPAVLLWVGASLEAEAVMNKALVLAVAVATTALAGGQPAEAYYNGPWCAVYSTGPGGTSERCDYRDFETCRMDIIAGNRGFCRQNGYYLQDHAAHPPRTRKPR
jgi:hypothetical protein